jgi:hypothetical protein
MGLPPRQATISCDLCPGFVPEVLLAASALDMQHAPAAAPCPCADHGLLCAFWRAAGTAFAKGHPYPSMFLSATGPGLAQHGCAHQHA